MKASFYADNEDIKNATRELIDTSFRKLRSAEGACELLQSFKSIKSKGAIQKQVVSKVNDILEQFAREIDTTAEIFEKNVENPPVTKNQPPVAGAIKWARSLLARTKQTMQKLQSTEEEIIRTTGWLESRLEGLQTRSESEFLSKDLNCLHHVVQRLARAWRPSTVPLPRASCFLRRRPSAHGTS